MKRNRGFSLVEIAVVVAIALILMSLGLTAISSQLSSAAYSVTKKRQDMIKDALVTYVGARRSLPCPYVPVAGTPTTGIAPALAVGPPPSCAPFGIVPYETLQLPREIAEDGWGNLFSYQVYSVPAVCPGTNGTDWTNPLCFGAGKSGALAVIDGPLGAAPFVATAVAVVVSHGPNGLGAWVAALGTRNADPVTCAEAHNALIAGVPGCVLVANSHYKGESQTNDDVVAYLTASDLITTLAKQGAINSAAAQVNVDLQTLNDGALYLNTSTPTCFATPANLNDPWGNAYSITSAPASDPLFCLWSTGGGPVIVGNPTGTCTCSSPVMCRGVPRLTMNNYRNRVGIVACP